MKMADEEKRLSEETQRPSEADASAASDVNPLSERPESPAEEKQASAQTDASSEKAQVQEGGTESLAEEEPVHDSAKKAEENTIAGRRLKGFQLDLGRKLEEIPEYTLHEDAGNIRKKRRKSAFARVMIGIIIVGISALLSMVIIFGAQDAFGFGKADRAIAFEVPQNATVADVAELLEEKGVVNSAFLFRVYYKLNNPEGSFHYGTYTLNSNMSYSMIITELFKYGASREEVSVTFPEGFTLYQMATRLEEKGVCSADDFIAAADNTESFGYAFEADLTDDPMKYHRLEGFLFPDTYFFYKNDSPANVIKKMLDNYQAKIEPYKVRMQELGMTEEDTIRLASIIQEEAGKTSEMEKVSSVYHNRLDSPSVYPLLQADPTRVYARELKEQMGTVVNQEILDAYDTYKSGGLPPGAICNPGEDAIKAALNPADTDYYFFCSNLKTGKFYYAKTYEEHQVNLRKAGLT